MFTSCGWIRTSKHTPVFGRYGFNNELNLQVVKNTSNVPILFDCALPDAGFENSNDFPPEYMDKPAWFATDAEESGCRIVINRHSSGANGGTNVLFLNGSSRKVGLKELWTLKWHKKFCTKGPWTRACGAQPGDWTKWMRKFKDY